MQIVYFLVNYQVIYVELIDKEKLQVLFSVFYLGIMYYVVMELNNKLINVVLFFVFIIFFIICEMLCCFYLILCFCFIKFF